MQMSKNIKTNGLNAFGNNTCQASADVASKKEYPTHSFVWYWNMWRRHKHDHDFTTKLINDLRHDCEVFGEYLPVNIDVVGAIKIYGEAWYDFLYDCPHSHLSSKLREINFNDAKAIIATIPL